MKVYLLLFRRHLVEGDSCDFADETAETDKQWVQGSEIRLVFFQLEPVMTGEQRLIPYSEGARRF
jgi:hypothetical protein